MMSLRLAWPLSKNCADPVLKTVSRSASSEVVVAEFELGCRFTLPDAERVEAGLAVAARAIGADQFEHPDLLHLVFGGNLGGDAFGLGFQAVPTETLEVGNDGAVGHIDGRVVHHRQPVEVAPPLFRHAIRIVEIGLVERLHVGTVAPGEVGTAPHSFDKRCDRYARRSAYTVDPRVRCANALAGLALLTRARRTACLFHAEVTQPAAGQIPWLSSMVRILPMARVGLRPLGQTLTQFMIPRQRNTLNGSSRAASRSAVAVSRLSARNR